MHDQSNIITLYRIFLLKDESVTAALLHNDRDEPRKRVLGPLLEAFPSLGCEISNLEPNRDTVQQMFSLKMIPVSN